MDKGDFWWWNYLIVVDTATTRLYYCLGSIPYKGMMIGSNKDDYFILFYCCTKYWVKLCDGDYDFF